MPKTKLGKVSISPKGEWNKTAVYEQLDLVTYNGGSWLCTFPNTAQAPAKGEYWTQIAAKGDTGTAASLKVEATDTGATITATDASGTTSANLVNGGITADGITAALGYTPAEEEGTFQFISSVTLEEDASISITGLSLRHCCFEAQLPKKGSATGSSLTFESNGVVTATSWISASAATAYEQIMYAELYPCGNYYFQIMTGFGITTNQKGLCKYGVPFGNDHKEINGPITAVKLGCVCTAGTTARVYGIPW